MNSSMGTGGKVFRLDDVRAVQSKPGQSRIEVTRPSVAELWEFDDASPMGRRVDSINDARIAIPRPYRPGSVQ
jgi:hypothetical protein